MSDIVKICKIHGNLILDQTYQRPYKQTIYYKCKRCILSKNIERKYDGMKSLDDYDAMLAKQKGVCGMCKGANNTTLNGKIKRFAIDHCHKTGQVRKLLCSFCNSMLGYSKDNPITHMKAIIYLTKDSEDILDEIILKLQERRSSMNHIRKRIANKN